MINTSKPMLLKVSCCFEWYVDLFERLFYSKIYSIFRITFVLRELLAKTEACHEQAVRWRPGKVRLFLTSVKARSKTRSSRKTRKPRRISFPRFSTPSFPFCTIPKTENSETKTSECCLKPFYQTPSFPFCTIPKTEKSELETSEFSLRFTRTAIFFYYLIKLRGFPTPSFPFFTTLKKENSEMENPGVWSDGVGENSEVFISEFSVLSVVRNGKVGVGKPRSLTKVPQSLMKIPQSKSPRFSTPTFPFSV